METEVIVRPYEIRFIFSQIELFLSVFSVKFFLDTRFLNYVLMVKYNCINQNACLIN